MHFMHYLEPDQETLRDPKNTKKCQQIVIIKGAVCWGEMERYDSAPMFLSTYE